MEEASASPGDILMGGSLAKSTPTGDLGTSYESMGIDRVAFASSCSESSGVEEARLLGDGVFTRSLLLPRSTPIGGGVSDESMDTDGDALDSSCLELMGVETASASVNNGISEALRPEVQISVGCINSRRGSQ